MLNIHVTIFGVVEIQMLIFCKNCSLFCVYWLSQLEEHSSQCSQLIMQSLRDWESCYFLKSRGACSAMQYCPKVTQANIDEFLGFSWVFNRNFVNFLGIYCFTSWEISNDNTQWTLTSHEILRQNSLFSIVTRDLSKENSLWLLSIQIDTNWAKYRYSTWFVAV